MQTENTSENKLEYINLMLRTICHAKTEGRNFWM